MTRQPHDAPRLAYSGQPDSRRWSKENVANLLEKGPKYDTDLNEPVSASDQRPMYRRDSKRSGTLPAEVPRDLTNKWKTDLGGELTQHFVARGKLYVSQIQSQQIYCLDSKYPASRK